MLPKHYTNEQTGIRYTLHGDYYLSDLVLHGNKSEYGDYTNTVIPKVIEAAPKRFASYSNKWMLRQSDAVVSCIIHAHDVTR